MQPLDRPVVPEVYIRAEVSWPRPVGGAGVRPYPGKRPAEPTGKPVIAHGLGPYRGLGIGRYGFATSSVAPGTPWRDDQARLESATLPAQPFTAVAVCSSEPTRRQLAGRDPGDQRLAWLPNKRETRSTGRTPISSAGSQPVAVLVQLVEAELAVLETNRGAPAMHRALERIHR